MFFPYRDDNPRVLYPYVTFSIIGLNIYKNTMDAFSLIKWIPNIIIGIFIGYITLNIIKKNKKKYKKIQNTNNIFTYYLSIIGKNTLILYLIHFPIIYFIVKYIFN